jgi:hypothetical protein
MNRTPTKAQDLLTGAGKEERNHERICRFMGRYMMKTHPMCEYDFIECLPKTSKAWIAEQKGRNINYAQAVAYGDLPIGLNKITMIQRNHNKGVIFFDLTDKLLWIKYDPQVFTKENGFRIDDAYQRGKRPDSIDNPKATLFIPTRLCQEVPL